MNEAGPLILQAFAWDMRADASHWRYLADHASAIADLGVSVVWLPPERDRAHQVRHQGRIPGGD